jgi:hypothetical protein
MEWDLLGGVDREQEEAEGVDFGQVEVEVRAGWEGHNLGQGRRGFVSAPIAGQSSLIR